ncbi:DUF58 domain-containing protein [Thaumasiovibrio subtropicus]|uniref:DUF58 domain-containing protein n=1 Tax=Thaumasiovibrio subtropicus TaxID=1891207 RepID=UPI000B35527D|nr:DUF58 domain-containing protein [Thaumasiovibrio subtropicus]
MTTYRSTHNASSLALPKHSDGIQLSLPELLHYQKQSVRWLPPARSIWSYLNGQHASRRQGRGMDFAEVRPYQQGDDIRAIDWRVTARTGKPHTKLFTEESECPVMVVTDLSATMQMGTRLLYKSVQAAHMASLICWLTVAQKDRIGAQIITDTQVIDCAPTARLQGPLHILGELRRLQANALNDTAAAHLSQHVPTDSIHNPFAMALQQLYRLCPKGSDIVIISDFNQLSPAAITSMRQLVQHNQLRLVNIFDPIEQGDTAYSGRSWLADLTSSFQVSFGRQSTKHALRAQFDAHSEKLTTLSHQLRAPLYHVSAGRSLLAQLGGQHG